jgi:hypothetical protein
MNTIIPNHAEIVVHSLKIINPKDLTIKPFELDQTKKK